MLRHRSPLPEKSSMATGGADNEWYFAPAARGSAPLHCVGDVVHRGQPLRLEWRLVREDVLSFQHFDQPVALIERTHLRFIDRERRAVEFGWWVFQRHQQAAAMRWQGRVDLIGITLPQRRRECDQRGAIVER